MSVWRSTNVWRSIVVSAVAFTATLGLSSAAHAAPLHVSAALVTAERRDDGVMWHGRYVISPEDAWDFHEGDILFARPLEPNEHVELGIGQQAIIEGGRVVGLHAERDALRDREIVADVFQRAPKAGTFPLGLPLAAGSAVQIVHVDLGGGAWIDVVDRPDLVRHIGYVAPNGVSYAAREEARRLTRYEAKINTHPIYLRGTDLGAGLEGRVTSVRERSRVGYVLTGVAFIAAVVGLVFASRKLKSAAMTERADALLAQEIASLQGDAQKRRPA